MQPVPASITDRLAVPWRYAGRAGLVALALMAAGCSELRYYRQSAGGQFDITQRRQPIATLIADDSRAAGLRARLAQVQDIRAFAIAQLGLPDTGSYTQYADLDRDYAVLALYAAPEFSTELKSWCYPVLGCASYRGYFDRALLAADARRLQQRGYEIYVAAVPAYSTLGWFDDPVLNTVLDWSDPQLAGLIFHELAHQQLYVKGDTVFNESFATAVERAGVERWLDAHGNAAELARYRQYWHHREQVVALILKARVDLQTLYAQELPEPQQRRAKRERLQALRGQYRAFRQALDTDPGFDGWFAGELNNAQLGSVAAYHTHVEAFLAILAARDGNLRGLYTEAARLAGMDARQREQHLAAWR